jgi:hypothetical protein
MAASSWEQQHSNDPNNEQQHGGGDVVYQAFLLPLEQQRLLHTEPHSPTLAIGDKHTGSSLPPRPNKQQMTKSSTANTNQKSTSGHIVTMATSSTATSQTTNKRSSSSLSSLSSLSLPYEPLPPLDRMPTSLAHALRLLVEQRVVARHERVTLVQVGANDGVTNDPLYKELVMRADALFAKSMGSGGNGGGGGSGGGHTVTDWRPYFMTLQIEPQPQLYQQLSTIGSPRDWYYYNGVVVAPPPTDDTTTSRTMTNATLPQCSNGTIAFCETKSPGVGDWKTQGQVNSVTMTKCTNRRKALHQHMRIVHRPCVSSWTDLLRAAAATTTAFTTTSTSTTSLEEKQTLFHHALDFLQVDTEGHDLAILQMVLEQTQKLRPLCVHYEHWGARQPAIDLLQQHGYTVIAERPKANDRLACRVVVANHHHHHAAVTATANDARDK